MAVRRTPNYLQRLLMSPRVFASAADRGARDKTTINKIAAHEKFDGQGV